MILVDTSVLVDLLRGLESAEVRFLKGLEGSSTPYAMPVYCAQELLQGARDKKDFILLSKYLHSNLIVNPLKPLKQHHFNAAKIFYLLRRRGVSAGSIDCLIAQLAIDNRATLLTSDKHFVEIAKVSKLSLLNLQKD